VGNTLGGVDTMIQGPRREFVAIIANRIVADRNMTNAVLAISNQNRQLRSCEADVAVLNGALQSTLAAKSELSTHIGQLQDTILNMQGKVSANKAWATVGKVGVITVVATGVVVGAIAIKQAFD